MFRRANPYWQGSHLHPKQKPVTAVIGSDGRRPGSRTDRRAQASVQPIEQPAFPTAPDSPTRDPFRREEPEANVRRKLHQITDKITPTRDGRAYGRVGPVVAAQRSRADCPAAASGQWPVPMAPSSAPTDLATAGCKAARKDLRLEVGAADWHRGGRIETILRQPEVSEPGERDERL